MNCKAELIKDFRSIVLKYYDVWDGTRSTWPEYVKNIREGILLKYNWGNYVFRGNDWRWDVEEFNDLNDCLFAFITYPSIDENGAFFPPKGIFNSSGMFIMITDSEVLTGEFHVNSISPKKTRGRKLTIKHTYKCVGINDGIFYLTNNFGQLEFLRNYLIPF